MLYFFNTSGFDLQHFTDKVDTKWAWQCLKTATKSKGLVGRSYTTTNEGDFELHSHTVEVFDVKRKPRATTVWTKTLYGAVDGKKQNRIFPVKTAISISSDYAFSKYAEFKHDHIKGKHTVTFKKPALVVDAPSNYGHNYVIVAYKKPKSLLGWLLTPITAPFTPKSKKYDVFAMRKDTFMGIICKEKPKRRGFFGRKAPADSPKFSFV